MGIGWQVRQSMLDVFWEPDQQALTYTTESTAAGIVRPAISGNALILEGLALGEAEITVTASDTYDGQTALSFTVSVDERGVTYTEGFNDSTDTAGWDPVGSEFSRVRVSDGELDVWGEDEQFPGIAIRAVFTNDFEVSAWVRTNLDTVSATVVLGALVNHALYRQVEIELFPHNDAFNYRVFVLDAEKLEFETWGEGSFGRESSDEYIKVLFAYRAGYYFISFNDDDGITVGSPSTTAATLEWVAMLNAHFYGQSDRVHQDQHAYMDAITVSTFTTDNAQKSTRSKPVWQRRRH